MEDEGNIDWSVFFNETPNEQTIPNPGGISDSDIAALETWVHENSAIDIDAPDCRQDHSQSPQDRRLNRPLGLPSGLGQSMGFEDLALELQLLKQK